MTCACSVGWITTPPCCECARSMPRLGGSKFRPLGYAPYTPFVAEELHQNVIRPGASGEPDSVHWCDFPEPDRSRIDERLERSMELALRVVNLARAARNASSPGRASRSAGWRCRSR